MEKIVRTIFIFLLAVSAAFAQEANTRNVIIITLDGYRWKELFLGADPKILFNKNYKNDTLVQRQFWDRSTAIRREKLMPFFWNVIGKQGQLYGNRKFKNKVNCSNIHLLSYPGYSEMLVGFADPTVSSNDEVENPNPTVLEFIQKHDAFKNKVAAFSTWGTFQYILREEKANIPVNAGRDLACGEISEIERSLNEKQGVMPNPYGERYDEITFQYALEFLKRERPRVMFIGFDETDEHAHGNRYIEYLNSAHRTDKMIGELWEWLQAQPDYKDQTTLFITTDHGRGKGKRSWKNHSLLAAGSGQIWFAVIGPDTPALGEMKVSGKYFQKQVAKTIAAFLGLQYHQATPVGDVVQTMISIPALSVGDTSSSPGYNDN